MNRIATIHYRKRPANVQHIPTREGSKAQSSVQKSMLQRAVNLLIAHQNESHTNWPAPFKVLMSSESLCELVLKYLAKQNVLKANATMWGCNCFWVLES